LAVEALWQPVPIDVRANVEHAIRDDTGGELECVIPPEPSCPFLEIHLDDYA
jgi:hypothetical protein